MGRHWICQPFGVEEKRVVMADDHKLKEVWTENWSVRTRFKWAARGTRVVSRPMRHVDWQFWFIGNSQDRHCSTPMQIDDSKQPRTRQTNWALRVCRDLACVAFFKSTAVTPIHHHQTKRKGAANDEQAVGMSVTSWNLESIPYTTRVEIERPYCNVL